MKDNEKRKPQGQIRVFVYGTLKRGHSNYGLLAGSELLGRCNLHGDYIMLDLTYYPGCVRTSGVSGHSRRNICGEVYAVDETTLYSLDLLEGHPNYYKRSKIITPFGNAWMYFLPVGSLDTYAPVEEGVWSPNEAELEFLEGEQGGNEDKDAA